MSGATRGIQIQGMTVVSGQEHQDIESGRTPHLDVSAHPGSTSDETDCLR